MTDILALFTLFGVSFLAATIVPAGSEVGLAAMIASDTFPIWLLVAIASLGNTLGSVVNWVLGRWIHRFQDRKWFPATPDQLARAERWYHKYGRWSLLLSWAPVVGDPLTLIAGVLREPFPIFLVLVALAKTGRYIVVALLALQVL